jgi:hypothetical protein
MRGAQPALLLTPARDRRLQFCEADIDDILRNRTRLISDGKSKVRPCAPSAAPHRAAGGGRGWCRGREGRRGQAGGGLAPDQLPKDALPGTAPLRLGCVEPSAPLSCAQSSTADATIDINDPDFWDKYMPITDAERFRWAAARALGHRATGHSAEPACTHARLQRRPSAGHAHGRLGHRVARVATGVRGRHGRVCQEASGRARARMAPLLAASGLTCSPPRRTLKAKEKNDKSLDLDTVISLLIQVRAHRRHVPVRNRLPRAVLRHVRVPLRRPQQGPALAGGGGAPPRATRSSQVRAPAGAPSQRRAAICAALTRRAAPLQGEHPRPRQHAGARAAQVAARARGRRR